MEITKKERGKVCACAPARARARACAKLNLNYYEHNDVTSF